MKWILIAYVIGLFLGWAYIQWRYPDTVAMNTSVATQQILTEGSTSPSLLTPFDQQWSGQVAKGLDAVSSTTPWKSKTILAFALDGLTDDAYESLLESYWKETNARNEISLYGILVAWFDSHSEAAIRAIERREKRCRLGEYLRILEDCQPNADELSKIIVHLRDELNDHSLLAVDLCRKLSAKDPEEHLAQARMFLDRAGIRRSTSDLYKDIFDEWIFRDPGILLHWTNERSIENRNSALRRIFTQLIRWNPTAALEKANLDWTIDEVDTLAESIGEAWVMRDPKNALKWANAIQGERGRKVYAKMIGILAEENPTEALQFASAEDLMKIDSFIQNLVLRNLDKALAWASSQRGQIQLEVISAVSEFDVNKAMTAFHSAGIGGIEYLKPWRGLIKNYAESDPNSALNLLNSMPSSEAQEAGFNIALAEMAKHSPATALEFVRELEWDSDKSSFFQNIYTQWTLYNWADAAKQLEAVGPNDETTLLMESLLLNADPNEPELVRQWVEDYQNSGIDTQAPSAFGPVVDVLLLDDPQQAIEWAQNQLEGPVYNSIIVGMASRWSAIDPVGASEWIASLRGGPARDDSVIHLVRAIVDDPERAMQWAMTIEDNSKREDILAGLGSRLESINP